MSVSVGLMVLSHASICGHALIVLARSNCHSDMIIILEGTSTKKLAVVSAVTSITVGTGIPSAAFKPRGWASNAIAE